MPLVIENYGSPLKDRQDRRKMQHHEQPERLRIGPARLRTTTPSTEVDIASATATSVSSSDSKDSWEMSDQLAQRDESISRSDEGELSSDFREGLPDDHHYDENTNWQPMSGVAVNTAAASRQQEKVAAEPSKPKLRKRFGPHEDYHLAVQAVADALNNCPDFNMEPIQGVTAQARFDTILAKFRTWEKKSAGLSGCAEQETPYIREMTGLVAKVDDHERAKSTAAEVNAGEARAKVHAGEVVRTAALSRIQLGKRRADTIDADSEEPAKTKHSSRPRKQQARVVAEWKTVLADMQSERAKSMKEVVQMQQSELKQRQMELEFERSEREKDRKEREQERIVRQKEHEEQTKLIATMLQIIQGQVAQAKKD